MHRIYSKPSQLITYFHSLKSLGRIRNEGARKRGERSVKKEKREKGNNRRSSVEEKGGVLTLRGRKREKWMRMR
jgi:hypothetical protein